MKVIRGAGRGSKGGSNRTPTEADDSLQSVQFAKVLDLLSEGPIQGLDDGNKSVYLDKTPIQDAAGTNNFQNYTVVTKNGTQDQAYITDSGTPADPEVFPVTFPVRFPVTFPTKEVAVKAPVPELKVNELEPANDPELLN